VLLSLLIIRRRGLLVATTNTEALVLLSGLAVSYGFQMWPALIAVCYWPFLTRQGVVTGLIAGLITVTVTDATGPAWLGIPTWGRWPLTIHTAGQPFTSPTIFASRCYQTLNRFIYCLL
jgi:solute:Na+ symporter, SSS family